MFVFELFNPNVGRMEKERDAGGLIEALGHRDVWIRCDSEKPFSEMRDGKALEPLTQALKDEDGGHSRGSAEARYVYKHHTDSVMLQ